MDKIDLEELERLAKAATPGPWKHRTISKTATVILAADTPLCATKYSVNKDHDAAYIVAACNAVPSLIARVRELETENERLKKQCEHLACDVVSAAQDYSAPMSDCRICNYDRFCKRKPSQIEPNWDMCEEAVLKACEPEEAGE